MKKVIAASMFLVLVFLAGSVWANAQSAEQVELALRNHLEGAKAWQAAAAVPVQPGAPKLCLPLETVALKPSLAPAPLQPTLRSERSWISEAMKIYDSFATLGVVDWLYESAAYRFKRMLMSPLETPLHLAYLTGITVEVLTQSPLLGALSQLLALVVGIALIPVAFCIHAYKTAQNALAGRWSEGSYQDGETMNKKLKGVY